MPRRRTVILPNTPPVAEQARSSRLTLPLHILLRDPGYRWPSKTIRQHVYSGNTSAGCFIEAGSGLEVSSPEFCFLQMAGQLSLIGLIELGYEMCGTYSKPIAGDPDVPKRGFYNREPLTSTKKLSAFIARMPGYTGHKRAVRALRYTLDDSESPMETKLAMFLTLPYKLGGFGFPKAKMNARITPSKTAGRTSGKAFYRCDLFWPDHDLAVEYDSNMFHTGSQHIADDSKKRNTLTAMGVKVITVTTQQLYHFNEFEKVARDIAKCIKKRLHIRNPGFADIHQDLRDQLLC